jgi:hypothetical protein
MATFNPRLDTEADDADYRYLADRFRRGDRLTDEERRQLHELAVAFGNRLLAEKTS